MLILLQPGIQPLGQFDLEDDDASLVVGGEVAVFEAINYATDGYAYDVFAHGPAVHLSLDNVDADARLYGLADEGTAAGVGKSYGTMLGQVIGATAGQGTGFGSTPSVGVVVVGPTTVRGSGKLTLWTKPGLYGTTSDAWVSSVQFGAATLNDKIYGTTADGTLDGKLTTSVDGVDVALVLGRVSDTSLVSTTAYHAGLAAVTEHMALYLLGVQS